MPSWSAWMIERAKVVVSFMSSRSARFLSAFARALADPHLVQHDPELLDQRALHALAHLDDRGVEAEARLDGDRQQVEHVGHLRDQVLLAGLVRMDR